ncbi:MAG: hypothetical protein KBH81_11490 [Phycisphaerae bacterium]|nr:hypothetical protein [Phycisphaerae bacterium]HPC23106.1 hypothetical protein [Phycisphaerae bacterium]HRS29498.1 hypothetical protein [Phycisphaerae bacterium]HRT42392.1 hypothetical protein [Phycisphaerae bacterium]
MRRRVRETTDVVTAHPGLTVAAIILLSIGGAIFVAMYPEMKRYLLAKRM